MFDKFGEFGSYEELNAAAKGFLDEGDTESLLELAKENGIDKEDVQDYIDGYVQELSSEFQAAVGRLEVQKKGLVKHNQDVAKRMVYKVILSMLGTMATEPEMARAIMGKGKIVTDIFKAMEEEASKHASGSGSKKRAVSCGTDQELRDIIRTYYLNPSKLKKKIAELYVFDGEA